MGDCPGAAVAGSSSPAATFGGDPVVAEMERLLAAVDRASGRSKRPSSGPSIKVSTSDVTAESPSTNSTRSRGDESGAFTRAWKTVKKPTMVASP